MEDETMHEHDRPTLSEARERLRIARTIRDAARQRGDTRVADLEDATIAKMEQRLAELEAVVARDEAGRERPNGESVPR